MHAIFFGLKRAYHGSLRVTRRALARLGLTAARFDLLYILHNTSPGLPQRGLQHVLGVTAPTVSRMLGSLEELGLIARERDQEDRRQRYVTLTEEGRRRVVKAVRLFIETGHIQLAVDSALCPMRWHERLESDFVRGTFGNKLDNLRNAYHDVATRNYPRIWSGDAFKSPGERWRGWIMRDLEF